MPSYAAFIGHQPNLSLAELSALVPDYKIQHIVNTQVVIFESSAELTAKDFQMLGGTIAIARELEKQIRDVKELPEIIAGQLRGLRGKAIFSFRTAGIERDALQDLYRTTKNTLRKQGIASRYVGTPREAAPAIVLHQEEILNGKHGTEIVIVQGEEFLWAGRTFAAQDINAYSKRDMEKPVRDTGVGLLPPKLAQMLLNFGAWLVRENSKNQIPNSKISKPKAQSPKLTVLDPFCGTGVIPMETLLRGWSVLASDSAQKAVDGTTTNLEWLRKEAKILKRDVPSTVWKQDARKAFDLKELPDVIVTETTLGPNLKKRPMLGDIKDLKNDNEKLQIEFLENMKASFPGVPLVVIWPVWYAQKKQSYLEKILEKLPKLGYEAVLPPGIKAHDPERPSLLYRRPDQFVGREIVLLRQKNG